MKERERERERRGKKKKEKTIGAQSFCFLSLFHTTPTFSMAAALLVARQSRRSALELARRAGELGSLR